MSKWRGASVILPIILLISPERCNAQEKVFVCPGKVKLAEIEMNHYKPYPDTLIPDWTSRDGTAISWTYLRDHRVPVELTVHCYYADKSKDFDVIINDTYRKCTFDKDYFFCEK